MGAPGRARVPLYCHDFQTNAFYRPPLIGSMGAPGRARVPLYCHDFQTNAFYRASHHRKYGGSGGGLESPYTVMTFRLMHSTSHSLPPLLPKINISVDSTYIWLWFTLAMYLILQIILAFGNYMNSSKRGGVYGFKVASLDMVSWPHKLSHSNRQ